MGNKGKVLHLPCRGRLPAKPWPLQHKLDRLASPPFPLPPPNHKHPGANGERPDGEHFHVIYLLIRRHKFAFLFNWLSDLWGFYCEWSAALLTGRAIAAAAPMPSRYSTLWPRSCPDEFSQNSPFGNIPTWEGAAQHSLAGLRLCVHPLPS